MNFEPSSSNDRPSRFRQEHVVAITIAMGLLLLASNLSSIWILSGVRAYIGAESLWSKAQKNAVNSLIAYIYSNDAHDYQEYLDNITVPLNDHLARLELGKKNPSFPMIDQFLKSGGNHAGDVRMMGYLFSYGSNLEYIRKSNALWENGDQLFSQLISLGKIIHFRLANSDLNSNDRKALLKQIQTLNQDLSKVEKQFSETLGTAARELEKFLLWFNALLISIVCAGIVSLLSYLNKTKLNLFKEAERYGLLANGVNQAAIVALTDAQGNITYVNQKFCQTSGYSAEELIGRNHRIINSGIHPREFFSNMWRTIQKGGIWNNEVCNKKKDGSYYWVDSTIVPIIDKKGYKQYLSIRFEVTERKRIEQQLIESSKLTSLGVMAAGIAHEINNPLAIVSGKIHKISRLLEQPAIDLSVINETINRIQFNISRISKIINGFKVFSRSAENDPFIEYDIHEILDETLSLCSERFKVHGIVLTVHSISHVKLMCNPTQLSQVILNLLNNAHDAIEPLPEKWINLKVVEFENQIKIIITDSGHGIPTEIINKIMEPFFSTKTFGKGTGLGLSISKSIIENHAGRLYVNPLWPPYFSATIFLAVCRNANKTSRRFRAIDFRIKKQDREYASR